MPGATLVTGGLGFLGSHFVRRRLARGPVVNFDLDTYAGSAARLEDAGAGYELRIGDVADRDAVRAALAESRPETVVHFAAESHVTRSETDPDRFWRTNVDGTRVLLEEAAAAGTVRRFVHISTDEVYGPALGDPFAEGDKEPGEGRATSPYARSKAVADDVAREHAGRVPVVVVRPTNCFGPWQYPEKAFARWVTRALGGRDLLVWGDGKYVRQWLYAGDLAEAVEAILDAPSPEPVYNVGPQHRPEVTNIDLARWLAEHLGLPGERIVFTQYDRPDHDRRYAVTTDRIEALGWRPGDLWARLAETVDWYRGAEAWWKPLVEEAESIYSDEPAEGGS